MPSEIALGRPLYSSTHSEFVTDESQPVRQSHNLGGERLSRRVSPGSFVIEQNRMPGTTRGLQTRRHCASMHRITSSISVARNEQNRWILHPILNPVIRRISQQGVEILRII